uniref:Uncharacterized protein n=1 Tax=Arundo donax TaxID=35708 RepID=A0A0A9SWZ4_ARUDO
MMARHLRGARWEGTERCAAPRRPPGSRDEYRSEEGKDSLEIRLRHAARCSCLRLRLGCVHQFSAQL